MSIYCPFTDSPVTASYFLNNNLVLWWTKFHTNEKKTTQTGSWRLPHVRRYDKSTAVKKSIKKKRR